MYVSIIYTIYTPQFGGQINLIKKLAIELRIPLYRTLL